MLSCHCLNIIIETEGDLHKVKTDTLELDAEDSQDHFFKDVRQVSKLLNINKSHSGLVQSRNVGPWVVHCCVNCNVHSHAVHREKGASCVLVNPRLFTKEMILKLQTNESYSKLYKIIINIDGHVDNEVPVTSFLPNEIESVIKGLKQVAADGLKTEAVKVEEKIRQFSDEQYKKLSELRERTFKEQQILTKIFLSNSNTEKLPTSTNSVMSTSQQALPSRLNEPLAAGSGKLTSSPISTPLRHTPKRQKSCPLNPRTSFDSEGLFELEGTDEHQSGTASEQDESDLDDTLREEGIKIPKRTNNNTSNASSNPIAKSLPMTIPAFLSASRQLDFEDEEDALSVEHNEDIAASMKALAKSVHGDTVFGDLPKPRYTYI